MPPENSELTGRRARRRRARGADAGGGRDGRKWVEHDSFYLITEVCRVCWHDAASTFFRTRPPERFSETNTTSKNVSRAHCRVRGTFGRKLNPFSRELRRVIRVRRETPGASPRARQSERPDDLEFTLDLRFVLIATNIDFVMMGCGRRTGTRREGTHVVAASARHQTTHPQKRTRKRARFRGLCVSPRARESHRVTSSKIELHRADWYI